MLGPAIGNDAQHILQSDIHRSAFPQIFWLAFLAPTNVVPQSLREQARQVWKTVCSGLSGDSMALLGSTIRSSVLSLILDTETVMRCVTLLCVSALPGLILHFVLQSVRPTGCTRPARVVRRVCRPWIADRAGKFEHG
jgi:hypothetical protein